MSDDVSASSVGAKMVVGDISRILNSLFGESWALSTSISLLRRVEIDALIRYLKMFLSSSENVPPPSP